MKVDDHQIRLYTGELTGRVDLIEKSLTAIGDKLDILDTGGQALAGSWDSSAYRQWQRELTVKLEQIRSCTDKMNRLLTSISEIAGMLAETEKRNSFLVVLAAAGR